MGLSGSEWVLIAGVGMVGVVILMNKNRQPAIIRLPAQPSGQSTALTAAEIAAGESVATSLISALSDSSSSSTSSDTSGTSATTDLNSYGITA